jgi:hypothetical protein
MYRVSPLKTVTKASIEPSYRKVNAHVGTFLIQLNLLSFYCEYNSGVGVLITAYMYILTFNTFEFGFLHVTLYY